VTAPSDYLDSVFGSDGVLAKAKLGYCMRPEQLQLAHGVASAFEERKTLLAEAPTGVGKSFAYLVPATYEAAHNDRKVIVVTANIALQEQIVDRDLPFLREHLPWKFSFALAKGWSNYVCKETLNDTRNDLLKRRLPMHDDHKRLKQIIEWADTTTEGDISELPFELGPLKQHVTIAKDDCLGKACDFYDDCFARQARKRLDNAQVLVANYHLFFADMSVKAGGGNVLPEYSLVVMDEGHKAADIAREFFGHRVTPGVLMRAVSMLDAKGKRAEKLCIPERIDPDLKQLVSELTDRVFADLVDLKKDKERYKARLDRSGLFDPSQLVAALRSADASFTRAMARGGIAPDGRKHLEQQASRCASLASALENAAGNIADEDWVYYLDDVNRGVALMAVPYSIADVLRPRLFEREDQPFGVVVASATLATEPNDSGFDFVMRQLGAESAETLVVDSPFDFSRCCLVVPRVELPNSSLFASQVAAQLVEATELAGGRTLALFTSYRVLEHAKRELLKTNPGFSVFAQGDAPRTQLLERFREDETSVLLGTESFWEGVDVPGPSLSCLFMDRIPFDHFLDPIADMVQAHDSRAFMNYMVPRAKIMFRQGFGRLIRSVSDQGIVVCCDVRLIDKPYGRSFVKALPPQVRVVRRFENAAQFLPDFNDHRLEP
jgi:ATP-dependent DNA helicase DinG